MLFWHNRGRLLVARSGHTLDIDVRQAAVGEIERSRKIRRLPIATGTELLATARIREIRRVEAKDGIVLTTARDQ